VNDEERIVQLEKELEETIMHGEESDRKFEEASLITFVKLWHTTHMVDSEKPCRRHPRRQCVFAASV